MQILLDAFFFALGAIVASFGGLVAARFNTGQSIVRGRSACDRCGKTLSAFALIPIFSYALQGGRARCCGARISPLAPACELLLGLLFLLAYLKLGLTAALALFLIALALLFVLVLYDFAHQILPPALLAPFVLAAAIFSYVYSPAAFGPALLWAAALALSLFLLNLLSSGRLMGFADAPLVLGLALLAGPVALSGFVYSFWIGAVIGIVVLARRPRGSRMGIEVPFAPFLAAGFLLAYFTPWNPFALVSSLLALPW